MCVIPLGRRVSTAKLSLAQRQLSCMSYQEGAEPFFRAFGVEERCSVSRTGVIGKLGLELHSDQQSQEWEADEK
jgi:glycine cleavage system aminomethyltransferase T